MLCVCLFIFFFTLFSIMVYYKIVLSFFLFSFFFVEIIKYISSSVTPPFWSFSLYFFPQLFKFVPIHVSFPSQEKKESFISCITDL